MKTIQRHLGLMLSSAIAVAGVWACTATRHSDGSVEFRFAPDMAITAFGLEDALNKLDQLLADCMSGAFGRTCTDAERRDIKQTARKVLEKKNRIGDPGADSVVSL